MAILNQTRFVLVTEPERIGRAIFALAMAAEGAR